MNARLVALVVGIALIACGVSYAAGRATREDAAASTEATQAISVEVSAGAGKAAQLSRTVAVPALQVPEPTPAQESSSAPEAGTAPDSGTGDTGTSAPYTPPSSQSAPTAPVTPPSTNNGGGGGGGGGECDFC